MRANVKFTDIVSFLLHEHMKLLTIHDTVHCEHTQSLSFIPVRWNLGLGREWSSYWERESIHAWIVDLINQWFNGLAIVVAKW